MVPSYTACATKQGKNKNASEPWHTSGPAQFLQDKLRKI